MAHRLLLKIVDISLHCHLPVVIKLVLKRRTRESLLTASWPPKKLRQIE
jgi:hypothetical protein